MKLIPEIICNNYYEVETFVSKIQSYNKIAFRGQSDYNYKLQTRIAYQYTIPYQINAYAERIMTIFTKEIEYKKLDQYFIIDSFDFPQANYKKLWQYIFQSQHIGIPTIAMDWSLSFNSALYFACKEENKEGQLWLLNVDELSYNHDCFDSKSIYCCDPNNVQEYYFIRPAFEVDNYCEILPQRRLYFQHGAFLVLPSNDNAEPLEEREYFKTKLILVKLTKECKEEVNELFNKNQKVLSIYRGESFIKEIEGDYYKNYNKNYFYGTIPDELSNVVLKIRKQNDFN